MNFDIIISNPPFNSGTTKAAIPIYNLIFEKIREYSDKIVYLIPVRWTSGGKGLEYFRKKIKQSKRIKSIIDYNFPSLYLKFNGFDIRDGLIILDYDKKYLGICNYEYYSKNYTEIIQRSLNNNISDFIFRNSIEESIISKIFNNSTKFFDNFVSFRSPFGNFTKVQLKEKEFKNAIKVFATNGIGGNCKRVKYWIDKNLVVKNIEKIKKWKLFHGKAGSKNSQAEIILGKPNEICTESFLMIDFESEQESKNCLDFMQTKFFQILLKIGRSGYSISKKSFQFIPWLDFNKIYTDEFLFNHFNLDKKEIQYIIKEIK